ncbi:MAG: hypothetical protein Q9182_005412 [Xanthomendoza sp. 2 TL-2023]
MAFVLSDQIVWHEGEVLMQQRLHVPYQENPTSPFLNPYAARLLPDAPLLALGTLDSAGRPWTTILGGDAGFVRPLGQSNIGIKTVVDPTYDPVMNILLRSKYDNDHGGQQEQNRPMSGLGINLERRSRVKLAGKFIAGALGAVLTQAGAKTTEAHIVFKVEQSLGMTRGESLWLPSSASASWTVKSMECRGSVSSVGMQLTSTGNCPKYLNKKRISAVAPQPTLVSSNLPLPVEAIDLLAKADIFFITTSHGGSTLGTNNRGGCSGFCRVMKNDDSGTILLYPEYSGNRLYQTLGNLQTTPKAGIVIPDFDSGDVLYLTGTTEILVGQEAATLLPRSNLAVKVRIHEARLIHDSLAFRGQSGEPSPYNPLVRFLATERTFGADAQNIKHSVVYAKLIQKELLTDDIGRFRFSVSDPEAAGPWNPGQYVALAFDNELGAGYSHMRDDDPLSLNDDLVRSFTISSSLRGGLLKDEFDITIRNVGKVTAFLFRQNVRAGLEVPLQGFSGSFAIHQSEGETVPFVAGGVGITPLLAQLPDLDFRRLRLFWTMRITDIGLALNTFERYPQLAGSTLLYISGSVSAAVRGQQPQTMPRLKQSGAHVFTRRLVASDIQERKDLSTTWYLCAGSRLRQAIISWLPDRNVIYESFDY